MIVAMFQSKADAMLVAVPMLGIMFAAYFRLDEMIGKPQKAAEPRRPIAGTDERGRPLCIDPDGGRHRRSSSK